MSIQDKLELLVICHEKGLDVSFSPRGMVSVFKWNKVSSKIEWHLNAMKMDKFDEFIERIEHKLK